MPSGTFILFPVDSYFTPAYHMASRQFARNMRSKTFAHIASILPNSCLLVRTTQLFILTGHLFMVQLVVPLSVKVTGLLLTRTVSAVFIQPNCMSVHCQTWHCHLHGTDSLIVLQYLQSYTPDHPVVTESQHLLSDICKTQKSVVLLGTWPCRPP